MCLSFQDTHALAALHLTEAPAPPDYPQHIMYYYAYKAVNDSQRTAKLETLVTPVQEAVVHTGKNTAEGNIGVSEGDISGGVLHLCVTEQEARKWSSIWVKVVVCVYDIVVFSDPIKQLAVSEYYLSQEEYDRAFARLKERYHDSDKA